MKSYITRRFPIKCILKYQKLMMIIFWYFSKIRPMMFSRHLKSEVIKTPFLCGFAALIQLFSLDSFCVDL